MVVVVAMPHRNYNAEEVISMNIFLGIILSSMVVSISTMMVFVAFFLIVTLLIWVIEMFGNNALVKYNPWDLLLKTSGTIFSVSLSVGFVVFVVRTIYTLISGT